MKNVPQGGRKKFKIFRVASNGAENLPFVIRRIRDKKNWLISSGRASHLKFGKYDKNDSLKD